MKKDTIRAGGVATVLLAIYILIAFLIPFTHTATFWVSFIFTLVAFAVVGASIYIAFIKNPDAKSRFYGFPIAKIGLGYGLAQLAAGILFMALAAITPPWVAVLVFAIGLGAAIIGLISAEAVVEEIHTQDAKLKKDTSLMRTLQSKVSHVASQCDNVAVKALADEFRYADPVSSEALTEIEADLSALVDDLQAAVVDGDEAAVQQLCKKTAATLAERSRLCKLNKQ